VQTPEVSIVLPTYNRAPILGRSIESVFAQSYASWELIVVDDRSTDGTMDVVADYQRRDGRVRYVTNDRYAHCCGGARARGIDELTGRYAAFLDSDDTWPAYHLQELVPLLEAHADVDWVFGNCRPIDGHGRPLEPSWFGRWMGRCFFETEVRGPLHVLTPHNLLENALRHGVRAMLPASLLRSSVFARVRVRDIFGLEDVLFRLEAIAKGVRMAYVEESHLDYVIHEDNVSAVSRRLPFAQAQKVQHAVDSFWREYVPAWVPLTPSQRRIARSNHAEHSVWCLGNAVYRAHGHRRQAMRHILHGIRLCPWRWRYWKTLGGTALGL
jgi:glycosyltransferase involved in cell wall biosynthesis